jgi:hypothetical protein
MVKQEGAIPRSPVRRNEAHTRRFAGKLCRSSAMGNLAVNPADFGVSQSLVPADRTRTPRRRRERQGLTPFACFVLQRESTDVYVELIVPLLPLLWSEFGEQTHPVGNITLVQRIDIDGAIAGDLLQGAAT